MPILSKLNHRVNVVHVSVAAGVRSETSTDEDVHCTIFRRRRIERSLGGEKVVYDTVVYFAPDASICESDEVVIDDIKRPITSVTKARNPRSMRVRFLVVELG